MSSHSRRPGSLCPNDGFKSHANELRIESDGIRLSGCSGRRAFSGRSPSPGLSHPRANVVGDGRPVGLAFRLEPHCRRHLKSGATKKSWLVSQGNLNVGQLKPSTTLAC